MRGRAVSRAADAIAIVPDGGARDAREGASAVGIGLTPPRRRAFWRAWCGGPRRDA